MTSFIINITITFLALLGVFVVFRLNILHSNNERYFKTLDNAFYSSFHNFKSLTYKLKINELFEILKRNRDNLNLNNISQTNDPNLRNLNEMYDKSKLTLNDIFLNYYERIQIFKTFKSILIGLIIIASGSLYLGSEIFVFSIFVNNIIRISIISMLISIGLFVWKIIGSKTNATYWSDKKIEWEKLDKSISEKIKEYNRLKEQAKSV